MRKTRPSSFFLQAEEMQGEEFDFAPGKILLGTVKGRLIGIDNPAHMVTIAGSRSGKTATSLMTNLKTWPGSIIAIDPKGELATNTAEIRARMGQKVIILDPFNEVKGSATDHRKRFNPIAELQRSPKADQVDDAALLADALIISDDDRDSHWSLSAKNQIHALLLYLMDDDGTPGDLIELRDTLSLPLRSDTTKDKETDPSPDKVEDTLHSVFAAMALDERFGGVIANCGTSFAGKDQKEASSILSTAVEQTSFLRSERLFDHLRHSDFSLSDLKRQLTTIYLVLPASRMATHYRWLRMIIIQALAALERTANETAYPVLFMLEEFPQLGYMRQIEGAVGLMAGYDVRLWTVIQDLSQLQRHYEKSWETFLGNAGIIEAFGNTDTTTTEYLSKRLGNTLYRQTNVSPRSLEQRAAGAPTEQEQMIEVPLLAPFELSTAFGRRKDRANETKLCMVTGETPFIVRRLFWKDAPALEPAAWGPSMHDANHPDDNEDDFAEFL